MIPKFPQDVPVSVIPHLDRHGRSRFVHYEAPWRPVIGADPWSQAAGVHLMTAVPYWFNESIDVHTGTPPEVIAAQVLKLQAKAQHELARRLLADERVADTRPGFPVTITIRVHVETWPAVEGVTTPERRHQP